MSTETPRTRTLRAGDGLSLHLAELGPADADKTVVIVHGYAEHGGRYIERAQLFVDAGFRVLIPDVRGHGRSGGQRGHVMEFGTYLDDLAVVLHEAEGSEIYLFGHSHGGLIVAAWLTERAAPIARAAMSSPFLGLGMKPPAWKLAAGRVLAKLLPKVSLPSEIDSSLVSHDAQVVADYEADPLNHKVNNARWFAEASAAQERAFAHADRVKVPLLVMQAGDDRIVSPQASRRWAGLAPAELVTFEMVPGAYHELFFEVDGAKHAERVVRWFVSGE